MPNLMAEWWQYLPEHIDPVAFTVGYVSVRWYAICFIFGFFAAVVAALIHSRKERTLYGQDTIWDASIAICIGILLGGRLGFALLYEHALLLSPLSLISPIDPQTGVFSGIHGMSFFGALIGSGIALFLYIRSRRLKFMEISDILIPAVPIALFFGRIGNFLNLELPGRKTTVPWGMYLPDPLTGAWELRHPSPLYEALLEGALLYIVLSLVRRWKPTGGYVTIAFLLGYAIVRFLVEFFREPDPGSLMVFGWMTIGQTLSLALFIVGGMLFRFARKSEKNMAENC